MTNRWYLLKRRLKVAARFRLEHGWTLSPGEISDLEPRREKATCVVCLDLRAMYGTAGWLALRAGRGR